MPVLQGVSNNYDTDLILPIVEAAARLAGIDYFSADRCGTSANLHACRPSVSKLA
jgi:alanyl-tRNA synthetase